MINDSRLDRTVAEGLMSLADVLIPEQNPWPAPSSTGLAGYFVEAVRVEQDQLELGVLHTAWANTTHEDPVEGARAAERLIPSAFALFRQICYMGYYAQPEVVRVLLALGVLRLVRAVREPHPAVEATRHATGSTTPERRWGR